MAPITPPIHDWNHETGCEIPTKHKEAIRELHAFGRVPINKVAERYGPGYTTIRRILNYDAPERVRQGQSGPAKLLTDRKLDEIIEGKPKSTPGLPKSTYEIADTGHTLGTLPPRLPIQFCTMRRD
ncbi:hypothetical protein B7463_g3172, partial [Scytalidium lignicola]